MGVGHAGSKFFPLPGQPVSEGKFPRRFEAVEYALRCGFPAGFFLKPDAGLGDEFPFSVPQGQGYGAGLALRRVVGDQLMGIGNRALEQIISDNPIDQLQCHRFLRFDRVAHSDQIHCGGDTGQPGGTLGTTRTGQQPQLDLRQANPGGVQCNSIVAGQCQFKSATQGGAMQGGNGQFRVVIQLDQ